MLRAFAVEMEDFSLLTYVAERSHHLHEEDEMLQSDLAIALIFPGTEHRVPVSRFMWAVFSCVCVSLDKRAAGCCGDF